MADSDGFPKELMAEKADGRKGRLPKNAESGKVYTERVDSLHRRRHQPIQLLTMTL